MLRKALISGPVLEGEGNSDTPGHRSPGKGVVKGVRGWEARASEQISLESPFKERMGRESDARIEEWEVRSWRCWDRRGLQDVWLGGKTDVQSRTWSGSKRGRMFLKQKQKEHETLEQAWKLIRKGQVHRSSERGWSVPPSLQGHSWGSPTLVGEVSGGGKAQAGCRGSGLRDRLWLPPFSLWVRRGHLQRAAGCWWGDILPQMCRLWRPSPWVTRTVEGMQSPLWARPLLVFYKHYWK